MEKCQTIRRKETGFTIVELMIVIAIVGVLASIANVSYTQFMRRSEVNQLARDFESALRSAKHHARTSGRTVSVCGTNEIKKNIPTCLANLADFNSGSTSQTLGWVVFYDVDADNNVTTGDKVFKKIPLTSQRVRMLWTGAMPVDITPRNVIGTAGVFCVYAYGGAVQTTCSADVAENPLNKKTYERRVTLTTLGNVNFIE